MKGLKLCPHMETLHVLTPYAITINMSRVSGHLQTDVEEYFKLFALLTKKVNCLLSLRPEVSKSGRLHYHGIIQFMNMPSIAMFYLNKFFKQENQKQANILLAHIDDLNGWETYIKKQRDYMRPLFEDNMLKYHYKKLY